MKIFFLLILINISFLFPSYAQRFYSVVFTSLPQDYQLYPRDDQNKSVVPIEGYIEVPDYTFASVVVLRNNVPVKYLKTGVTYDSKGVGRFALQTSITAELAQYDFKVSVGKPADSVLIAHRKNVVSGDVYVVGGQSNSTGFFTERETNDYCRTFGAITQELNTGVYNSADTLWALSNKDSYTNGVGTMGLEIQKQLSQQSGIPNCLINAGTHWSSAGSLANRNANNPMDFNTSYGRMLYRLHKGGLTSAVKSYIFRQGETETYHEATDWQGNFKKLRDNLKSDLPNLQKFYVFQIDVIFYASLTGATIRDYQRRINEIYPDAQSLATVGTTGFDGLHYSAEGNRQNGLEMSRLIARDFYQSTDTLNIASPNPRKVYYNEDHTQLILAFDSDQQLLYPANFKVNDQLSLAMKDFFYLNNETGGITSGSAEGNRIILNLATKSTAARIDYLPPFVPENSSYFPYRGPHITNTRGVRAFSFYNVPIYESLLKPNLTATLLEEKDVSLKWNVVPDATSYILERKKESETSYSKLATLTGSTVTFTDNSPFSESKISYRLKAIGTHAESAAYSTTEVSKPIILGEDLPGITQLFTAYPNPAQTADKLTLKFKEPFSGEVQIVDQTGKVISSKYILRQYTYSTSLSSFPSGMYHIKATSKELTVSRKVIVR